LGIHVIPLVVYVRDAATRQEAFERVKAAVKPNAAVSERTGRGFFPNEPMSVEFPNDEPDGAWHLGWLPGPPPNDLDGMIENIGQHEEETE
jgi:hypothetical protein